MLPAFVTVSACKRICALQGRARVGVVRLIDYMQWINFYTDTSFQARCQKTFMPL